MAREYSLRGVLPPPDYPLVDLKTGAMTEAYRLRAEAEHTVLFGADGSEDVTQDIPTGSYLASVDVDETKGLTQSGTPGPGWTVSISFVQALRTTDSPQFVTMTLTGNLVIAGLADGRDLSVDGAKLDGIEAGATADQTAAEILTAIKTVDGSASGLDADLLDGQQGTYYLAWGNFSGTPTTIAGYGITDAYTKAEVDTAVGGKVTKDATITAASEAHAVTDFATANTALNALGAIINEIRASLNA